MLMFITGCEAQYNITIRNNKTIDEKIYVKEANTRIEANNMTKKSFVEGNIRQYENVEELSKVKFSSKYEKNTSGIIGNYVSSFNDFSKSQTATQIFSNVSMTDKADGYSFYMYGFNTSYFSQDSPDPDSYGFEKMTLSVKSHYEVTSNNADEVDEKSNIYTWNINENFVNSKNVIQMEFGYNKRYDVIVKDIIIENIASIILLGCLLLAVLVIGITFYLKNKRINKI